MEASVFASMWHSPKAVKPAKPEQTQHRARSGLFALLFPLLQCWRASYKFTQTERWRQLGSVRLQASANKPCQIKLSIAEPFGTIRAYQPRPNARNDMTRTPAGSVKNHLDENIFPLVVLSGFLCCKAYPSLPFLQIRVGWLF